MIILIITLSKIIADFFYKNNIVDEVKRERIQYGFQTIFSTIISFLIVIVSGIVFNILDISLVFLALFVLIRRFTGGYHADTYLKCNLCFAFVYFLTMAMVILTSNSYSAFKAEMFLVYLFSDIVIISYAPIENKNKPQTEIQLKKNRLLSILLTVIVTVISIFISIYNIRIFLAVDYTLLSIAVLILIAKSKRKERK